MIVVALAACQQPPATQRVPAAETKPAEAKPAETKPIAPGDAALVEYAVDRRGFLYLPAGDGPFPVIVFNHGSEEKPGKLPNLAHYYLDHGWAFFLPHRRGHGESGGVYAAQDRDEQRLLALHEEHSNDVAAAVAWVKQQPHIDGKRVVVSGCSFGGIQTMLAAARPLDIRAAIAFAPGAIMWRRSPGLQQRLIRAAREAQVPELIIQAENDFDLSPSKVAGAELERTGHGKATIYPAVGTRPIQGHTFCVTGYDTWGPDVLDFLARTAP